MQKSSVNKVIIVGNLGQDPEARFTPQKPQLQILVLQLMNLGKLKMGKFKIEPNGTGLSCMGKWQKLLVNT